jgi:hypothetical protein
MFTGSAGSVKELYGILLKSQKDKMFRQTIRFEPATPLEAGKPGD